MGMPCIPGTLMTDIMDSSNCISLQTISVEELSVAQFQTLITVPFSEILVIDETSQLKPPSSLVVQDLAATTQLGNNLVVYLPSELTTAPNDEMQMARQWYEDSMVATQAMDFLSQVLALTTDKPVGENMEEPEDMVSGTADV